MYAENHLGGPDLAPTETTTTAARLGSAARTAGTTALKVLKHRATEQAMTLIVRSSVQISAASMVLAAVGAAAMAGLLLLGAAWGARFLLGMAGGVIGTGGFRFNKFVHLDWIPSALATVVPVCISAGRASDALVAGLYRGLRAI